VVDIVKLVVVVIVFEKVKIVVIINVFQNNILAR